MNDIKYADEHKVSLSKFFWYNILIHGQIDQYDLSKYDQLKSKIFCVTRIEHFIICVKKEVEKKLIYYLDIAYNVVLLETRTFLLVSKIDLLLQRTFILKSPKIKMSFVSSKSL